MILVDTAVWIDFFKNKSTPQVLRLIKAIESNQDLYICGIILTEILQGIKNQREYDVVCEKLESLLFVEMPKETFILSAQIYRRLKARGIAIRKTLDCLIAAVAITNNLSLLHKDKDFYPMEKHCGLSIWSA